MSLPLDPSTTKNILAKGLGNVKIKKEVVKLIDRVGSLFLLYLISEYIFPHKIAQMINVMRRKRRLLIKKIY